MDDLEFIPEGSGMRMRIPQYKVEVALEKAAELLPHTRALGGTEEEEEEEESDLTASFVVTTRYVSLPFLGLI